MNNYIHQLRSSKDFRKYNNDKKNNNIWNIFRLTPNRKIFFEEFMAMITTERSDEDDEVDVDVDNRVDESWPHFYFVIGGVNSLHTFIGNFLATAQPQLFLSKQMIFA